MNSLTDARIFPHTELDSPNSAVHLGQVYFFCSTADRDKFEASQLPGEGRAAVLRSGDDQEARFEPAEKVIVRPRRPASLSSPFASFLG